jgi:serine/threonine-protein kinase
MRKLADFGLAKLEDRSLDETRTGTKGILGTTAYMSPEQATGGDTDARSDIFSFGVVLYEMLAGKRPFDGNSSPGIIQKILMQQPPPLSDDIPPAVRNIVEKALEKEPVDRYQAMREMVVDLRRVARRGDTVSDVSRPAPDIAPRSRWWIPAIALLVILDVIRRSS